MRYFEEARVRLTGDKARASSFLPAARTLLGELLNRSQTLGGLSQDSVSRVLAPGVTAVCYFSPGHLPTVEIIVVPVGDEEIVDLVGVLIDFVATPNPFVQSDSRRTPHVFDALITAFRDPNDVLGVAVVPEDTRFRLLGAGRNLYSAMYAYESEPYPATVEETTLPTVSAFDPFRLVDTTVPLPSGEAVYRYLDYTIAFGWGTSHSQGELPRRVVANRQNVFVLLERTVVSEISFNGQGEPTAMTGTILLDAYNFDGSREFRVQLAPSYEQFLATGAHSVNESIAAYDQGFYALLKPTPNLAGYDLIKWSVEDGFQWAAPALPDDVTDPLTVHAGPLGPYLVDLAGSGYPRISWLSPATGEQLGQLTVFPESYPSVVNGFISSSVAVTADFIYVSIGIEPTGISIGAQNKLMLIYTHDLQLERVVDMEEIAEIVEVENFELGYAVPYEDASRIEAA